MISDELFASAERIKRYLKDFKFNYEPDKEYIESIVAQMDLAAHKLCTVPITVGQEPPPEATQADHEVWDKDKAAQIALREFIDLQLRMTPKQRLTMLTFFGWCAEWAPKTGYARLLKALLQHYGETDVTEVANLQTGNDRADTTTAPSTSEYFAFKRPTDEVARRHNRTVLSEGINTARCLMCIPTTERMHSIYVHHLEAFGTSYYFNDVEVYDNGALNIFVKKRGDVIPIGVVRVRPEYVEET